MFYRPVAPVASARIGKINRNHGLMTVHFARRRNGSAIADALTPIADLHILLVPAGSELVSSSVFARP
jgi:hypothetical protein